jgi:integral membrane protein
MKLTLFFRRIALLEGISFLLILFVTMPLKYIWNIPEPTYYIGMAHGVLFVAYVALAFYAHFYAKWNFLTLFLVLAASLIPFGTFVADKHILKKVVNHQPE